MLQLRTLLSIIVLFTFSTLSAQELPPIVNYKTTMYNGGNQNWSITQSKDKYIYVANNDGLLEFNGAKWTLHPSPNNTIVRSVGVKENTIFSGSYMDFGYWEKDNKNQLNYTSLSTTLHVKVVEDEQFWGILTVGSRVLFQSLNRIYIYNMEDDSIKIIDSENTIHKIFKVDSSIYFHVFNEGIYTILDGEKKLINSSNVFKEDPVVGIFEKDSSLIIVTGNNGIYTLLGDGIVPYDQDVNAIISDFSIYSSMLLNDGTIALGTISNGIVRLGNNNTIDFQMNQYNGLGDNTVLSLFEDDAHNVWIGLDNGIDCLNLKSPYTNYIDQIGNIGTVYDSALFNDYLYLGTNQGLFYKKKNTKDTFKLIASTEGQVWTLNDIDGILFCGHNKGTFIVDIDKVTLISNIAGTWGFKKVPNNPNRILQGNYNGLHILEKEGDSWKYQNKVKGFDISSRYFEFSNTTTVLVSHEYKGVYKVTFNEDLTQAISVTKDTSVFKGANSSITSFDSSIFYASSEGFFRYDDHKAAFTKDETLSKLIEENQYISGKMVIDDLNTLWFFTKNYIHAITKETLSDEYKIKQLAIPFSLRNEMKGFENMRRIGANTYLFGTLQGYILIDVSEMPQKMYDVNLNKVYSGISKNQSKAMEVKEEGIFPSNNNYISFEYSIPEYSKYLEAEYSYRLDGSKGAEWSEWTTNTSVTYENLKYGAYTFDVKSKINNEELKEVIHYNFEIRRPWYLSYVALFCYAICIGVFIFLLRGYYSRKYKLKELRLKDFTNKEIALKELENQKEIINLKNEKLNQDIEARNRELAISTMSMIKNNNALNALKDELVQLNSESELKPIIKKIDKNLNSNEDWEFFEEAFNHADKDFFKK